MKLVNEWVNRKSLKKRKKLRFFFLNLRNVDLIKSNNKYNIIKNKK